MTREEIERKITEEQFSSALKLLAESENLRKTAENLLDGIDVEFCNYIPSLKDCFVYSGIQGLADRLGIETHTEPHGENGQQLVCKWRDVTLFELGQKVGKEFVYR